MFDASAKRYYKNITWRSRVIKNMQAYKRYKILMGFIL